MDSGASSGVFRRRFILFLLPGLYQAALPLFTLPLTTLVLVPADFALYSVANAISALLATLAQLGSAFTLAQRFGSADTDERRRLVSTVFFQGLAFSTLCTLLMLALWPMVRSHWVVADEITMEMLAVVLVATIGSSLYTLAGTLAVYGHAPGSFSLVTVLKATASVAATLLGLFVFHLDVFSLFVGLFAGAVFELVGSMLLMRPFLVWRFDRKVAGECLSLGGWSSVAHLAMQGRLLLERGILSTTAGLHDLGLYVHAQQYQNYAMLGTRPIHQALTPVMLEEATSALPDFSRTARVTRVLYLAITLFALFFAFLGKEIIHILTNGTFDAAAPYAALMIGALLLQSAGRPQFARLLSQGRGRYLSICNIVSVVGSAALLVVLAPRFGMAGALAAVYLQFALFRAAIELDTLWSGRMPFQDVSAVMGISLIGGAVAAVVFWEPGVWLRAAMFAAAFGVTIAFNQQTARDVMDQVRVVWGSLGGKAADKSTLAIRKL